MEHDAEILAVNPAGLIPALQDRETVMVGLIAILQYLVAKYGQSKLAPGPADPSCPLYMQFLHLDEAGLAVLLNAVFVSGHLVPEPERGGGLEHWAMATFESRLGLVTRQ